MYMRDYPNLHLDITTSLGCSPQVSIDLEFEHRSSQTKDYKIGICCIKDCLDCNQDNVSEWNDMSTR